MIKITVRSVTPIFTSRGQIKESKRIYKHVDLSGLTVKGNVRRFFRTIYYPFLSSKNEKIRDIESKIFGSTANIGGASQFAFEALFDDEQTSTQWRYIAKIRRGGRKSIWVSDLALPEGIRFDLIFGEHLYNASLDRINTLRVLRSLEAWVIFGGYGKRTRKGLGSLIVESIEGKVGDVNSSESIFARQGRRIDWDSLESLKCLVNDLFSRIVQEELGNTQVSWERVIESTDPWRFKHPVLSRHSVIAVGDTDKRSYTEAISFIHRNIKENVRNKFCVGLSGGRNPSQLMISLKRDSLNESYKFVLLFAPRGDTKNPEYCQGDVIKALEQLSNCKIIYGGR